MARTSVGSNDKLSRGAQQRVKQWLLSPELTEFLKSARETRRRASRVGPHITISREAGTNGDAVGRLVGRRMRWDVLGKELLEFMADRYGVTRGMLELVDESRANWVHDIFGQWIDSNVVSHEKYFVYLQRILWLAGIHGRVVLLGRGGQFTLPRQNGLAVRIVAPKSFRVASIARQEGVSVEEARRIMEKADAGRRDFVMHYFHRDGTDPQWYDLTINVERVGIRGAARLIVSAYRSLNAIPESHG